MEHGSITLWVCSKAPLCPQAQAWGVCCVCLGGCLSVSCQAAIPLGIRVPDPHAPLAGGVEWTVSRLTGSSFHESTLPLHLGRAEESLGLFSVTTSQPQREGHISELKDTQAPPAGWPWQFWQLEKGMCLMKETTPPSTRSSQNLSSSSQSWFPKSQNRSPWPGRPRASGALLARSVFFFLLNTGSRHRRMPDLSWPLWQWRLRQHARQLWVRVFWGLRERLHDDEELYG